MSVTISCLRKGAAGMAPPLELQGMDSHNPNQSLMKNGHRTIASQGS